MEIDTYNEVATICDLIAVSLSILASVGNSSTFHSDTAQEVAYSYIFGMINMVIGTSLLTIFYPFGQEDDYSGQLTRSGVSSMLIIILCFYWMWKGNRLESAIRARPENDEARLESILISIAEPVYLQSSVPFVSKNSPISVRQPVLVAQLM